MTTWPEKQRSMPEWDLSQPTRQSILGVVVYLLRNFRALLSLLITAVIIGAAKPQVWIVVGIAVIPFSVIAALFAYWQYRNFTFQLDGDDLIIKKGVIFRDRTVISVDRIQTVKIAESIVQRILGLVALKVDTAGSSGSELEIPALERKAAMLLKDLLYKKKEEAEGTASERTDSADPASEAAPEQVRTSAEKKVLVKLNVFDLLLVGLTENHLKTGFVALAVVFGYFSQFMEYLQEYLEAYVDEYARTLANAGLAFALSALVLFAVVSVLLSVIRTFLRFFNLKAVLLPDAVEIETGLLKRNYDRIPVRKIQFAEWETNPLRRLVGFESVRIRPTDPVGQANKQQRTEIPALRRAAGAALAEGIFPGYVAPQSGFKAVASAYARINLIIAAAVFMPVSAVLWYFHGLPGLFPLFVLPLTALFSYRYGRTVRVLFDRQFLLVRKGWIFPSRLVLPIHKLQSVAVSTNVFLKRRKLCHLNLYTAAGARKVRYLKEKEAARMYNYMLWCVEKSDESWM